VKTYCSAKVTTALMRCGVSKGVFLCKALSVSAASAYTKIWSKKWTGLTLLNGFSFLVIFFFFILGRAVD